MPKYANTLTGEIVEYPAEAAALFPALKLVPSERESEKRETVAVELDEHKVVESSLKAEADTDKTKVGRNAK